MWRRIAILQHRRQAFLSRSGVLCAQVRARGHRGAAGRGAWDDRIRVMRGGLCLRRVAPGGGGARLPVRCAGLWICRPSARRVLGRRLPCHHADRQPAMDDGEPQGRHLRLGGRPRRGGSPRSSGAASSVARSLGIAEGHVVSRPLGAVDHGVLLVGRLARRARCGGGAGAREVGVDRLSCKLLRPDIHDHPRFSPPHREEGW
mmetsp:Transcript_81314/g.235785  ORF Transcript_81314/g.235785 Transcript_81314/m.235785 type:complete len:203 (+) Transcript_81314:660-1268(+)